MTTVFVKLGDTKIEVRSRKSKKRARERERERERERGREGGRHARTHTQNYTCTRPQYLVIALLWHRCGIVATAVGAAWGQEPHCQVYGEEPVRRNASHLHRGVRHQSCHGASDTKWRPHPFSTTEGEAAQAEQQGNVQRSIVEKNKKTIDSQRHDALLCFFYLPDWCTRQACCLPSPKGVSTDCFVLLYHVHFTSHPLNPCFGMPLFCLMAFAVVPAVVQDCNGVLVELEEE